MESKRTITRPSGHATSTMVGASPVPRTAVAKAAARFASRVSSSTATVASGTGCRRNASSVMTAIEPSEPHSNRARS